MKQNVNFCFSAPFQTQISLLCGMLDCNQNVSCQLSVVKRCLSIVDLIKFCMSLACTCWKFGVKIWWKWNWIGNKLQCFPNWNTILVLTSSLAQPHQSLMPHVKTLQKIHCPRSGPNGISFWKLKRTWVCMFEVPTNRIDDLIPFLVFLSDWVLIEVAKRTSTSTRSRCMNMHPRRTWRVLPLSDANSYTTQRSRTLHLMYGTFEISQTFLKFECSEQHSSTIAIEEPWVNTCCNTHSSRSSANSAVKPSGTTIPRAYRCLKKAFALKHLVKRSAGFSTPLLCLNFNKPSLICSRNQCNLISMCRERRGTSMDLTSCNAELESLSNQITISSGSSISWSAKKKTVNQSSKRNTFLTHRLQTIELCMPHVNSDSKLAAAGSVTLPKISQRKQLHRWHLPGCWNDTAHVMRRWKSGDGLTSVERRQPDSWWSHPCSVDTSMHACQHTRISRLLSTLVLSRASASLAAFQEQTSMFQVMSNLWQPKQFSQRLLKREYASSDKGFWNFYPWVFSQDVPKCQDILRPTGNAIIQKRRVKIVWINTQSDLRGISFSSNDMTNEGQWPSLLRSLPLFSQALQTTRFSFNLSTIHTRIQRIRPKACMFNRTCQKLQPCQWSIT